MKYIPLVQDISAIVDDEDYPYISRFRWSIGNGHAKRTGGTAPNCWCMNMEFLIKSKGANDRYFFKNGNPLDLRKDNLEVRSFSNASIGLPKMGKKKTSEYKGVCWDKRAEKWSMNIKHHGKKVASLLFEFEVDAARAYNDRAFEIYGDLAYLNKI